MRSTNGIKWWNKYWDREIASGTLIADMSSPNNGSFQILIAGREQRIVLVSRPRHFGGRQWYFICPYMDRPASVLWMPAGAKYFGCRQRWGRQVAYSSQFLDRDNRAHRGQAKIKARLCRIGGYDPDEWDLPPKPKWMRWRTYERAVDRFDKYEDVLDEGIVRLAAKLGRRV
jgi:hypothetical protein